MRTLFFSFLFFVTINFSFLYAEDSVLFYSSFDGTPQSQISTGDKTPRLEGNVRYIDGIKGKAAVVGGKNRILYQAANNISPQKGTCSFWICPLDWTPKTEHFNFFITFTHRGDVQLQQTVRIILYKMYNEASTTLLVQNATVPKTNSIKKDIALWQPGIWHHLAFSWDETKITLYVDGEKSATMPPIPFPETDWENIILGIPYPSWAYLGTENTAVDELHLYSRVLSAEEIKEQFKTFQEVASKKTEFTGTQENAETKILFHVPFDENLNGTSLFGLATPTKTYGSEQYVKGIKGNAVIIGGENRILYNASGNLDSKQGTLSAWVCPLNWSPETKNFVFFTSFLTGKSSQDLLLYKLQSSTELNFLERNTSNLSSSIKTQMLLWRQNQWQHIVIVWDQNQKALYINGEKVAERPRAGYTDPYTQLVIGNAYPSWAYLGNEQTAVDELLIYSSRLTDEEIEFLYTSYIGSTRESRMGKKKLNLALKENGAWILSSSFGNYDSLYEDNLIDGTTTTLWKPLENEYPQTLELRWQYPLRINEFSFNGVGINKASIYARNRASNEWQKIKTLTLDEINNGLVFFSETKTDRLRFIIEQGNKLTMASLGVYGPEQPLVGKSMPYWNAWYIWFPEPDKTHKGNQPRYFRKTFELSDISFESAYIQARSNDYYKIWINGKEVSTGSTSIYPVKVTQLLKKGRNVITAEADLIRNPGRWGHGEFITELSINYAGESRRIGTGSDWKSSDTKHEGWLDIEFNDSQWKQAEAFVQPPEGPWGKITYHSTSIRETAMVDSVTISPKTLSLSSMARIEVLITQPKTPLKRNYFFVFELGEKGIEPSKHGNYIVSREVIDPTEVKKLPNGTLSIQCNMPLPPYAPSGKIPLRMMGYDLESGIGLHFQNIEENEIARLDILSRREYGNATGKAHISYTNEQASFIVDDKVTTPFFFRYTSSSEPERTFHRTHDAGIYIVHLSQTATLVSPEKDFSNIDQMIRNQVAVSPDSRIILEFDLRARIDWLKENMNERLINAFGQMDVVSYSSEKYLETCINYLNNVIIFLKNKPYWNKIIGFQPFTCGTPDSATGGTGINTWQADRNKITVGDFNPRAITLFREFLREKYHNDSSSLKKAWHKPEITFDNAMPDRDELVAEGKDGNIFRDPSEGCMTFDYAEFFPTMLGNFYRKLALFIKTETNWEKMVFIHYGFLVNAMRGYNNPGSGLNNNNYNLTKMLDDPAIDGYIGSPNYGYRLAGSPVITYFVWSTYRLHGRMYLPDDDHRYHVAGVKSYGRLHSLRETRSIIRRNIGAYITRNFGSWFADMSRGEGRMGVSWTGEKEVAEILGEMNRLYGKAIDTGYKSASEIAVIFSAESNKYLDVYYGPTLMNNLIAWMYYPEFFKLGAPFDVYLAEDLTHPKIRKDYKLYIMMNTFYLTDAQRAAVENLKCNGTTILWFYAPGYVSDKGLSTKQISDLTGITVEQISGKEQIMATLSSTKHPLAKDIDSGYRFGAQGFGVAETVKLHPTEFGPRFRIVDNSADIIAKFDDGKGALAARNFGEWKSVYSVVPRLEADFLRNISRWAGVHVYTEDNVIFDANRNFIVLHNGYNEEKKVTLTLPKKTSIYDALTDKLLASEKDTLKIDLEKADTKILFLK
jgi:hypothetical protein